MSIGLFNIVIPNNKVETVEGKSDFHSANLITYNLPSVVSTPDSGSAVWEVFYRPVAYGKQSKNPASNGAKFENPVAKKCVQCPTLTTRDLHSESDSRNRPRYNGVIFRLDNFEVNYKYLSNFKEVFSIKCRDIKRGVWIK